MLLRFGVENYLSFREYQEFSLVASAQNRSEFEQVHAKGALPEEIREVTLSAPPEGLGLLAAMVAASLAATNGKARQLVEQGGVRLNQEKITDSRMVLPPGRHLLQVGKREFVRVNLKT